MRRLPAVPLAACDAAQAALFQALSGGPRAKIDPSRILVDADGGLVGPFNAWIHRPDIGERWSALGEALRFNSSLAPDLFELVVLTVAASARCAYEWGVHARHALRAGLKPEVIDAIGLGKKPPFNSETHAELFDFAKSLAVNLGVPQESYEKLLRRFGASTLVELVSVVGYYLALAAALNAFEVPAPAGTQSPWDRSR